MVLDRPGGHTEAPGPLIGAGIWREVVRAAGGRCECTGGCGDGKHYVKGRMARARTFAGRCTRGNSPVSPLHAVPVRSARPEVAMRLTAAELEALCDECDAGVQAARRRQERVAAAARLASDQGTLW